jgi:exopolyphosphatase/guanosine-5'-triphosphate,3'-diphosphate pyrophosphatase
MTRPKKKPTLPVSQLNANKMPDHAPEDPRLHPVLQLAQICEFEAGHSRHVTFLALRLFDELQPLHQLGPEERFWLQAGSLLHDIGWVEGWRSHHKTSMRIILSTPMLPFSNKERLIIGSIARYHRKGLPKAKNDNYAALPPATQRLTSQLSAFLRLADGLDRSHCSLVSDLTCRISDDKITILCKVTLPAEDELASAREKSDLLRKVYKKKVDIEGSLP